MNEVKGMSPLTGDNTLKYIRSELRQEEIDFKNSNGEDTLKNTLAANRFFQKHEIDCFNKVSRYGYLPIYETESTTREYLFFTKPDLNIFGSNADGEYKPYDVSLNTALASVPYFVDANNRNKDALRQLQYSVKDSEGMLNPFMYSLSNAVTSKLDLPAISADSRESTSNIMGTTIQYRGHSYKSDTGYDFTLSFTDTNTLDIYTTVKAYDEYIRLLKTGQNGLAPIEKYITSRIISEQFSIYKFIVGEDGETIVYYAKLTGCYFTDVPRADLSDPGNDGIKFSLSFHAQFVEDSNPLILTEFNRISPRGKNNKYVNVYDYENNVVDNTWVRWPKIVMVNNNDKHVKRRGTTYDYRLKWIAE